MPKLSNRTATQIAPSGQEAPNLLRNPVVPDAETSYQQYLSQPTSPIASPRAQLSATRVNSGVAAPTSIEDHIDDVLYIISYHVQTRLADGRPAMIVDPGSVVNLCGGRWAKEVAIAASRCGQKPTCERRRRPLEVSGVGTGSQSCEFDCKLPVAFQQADGQAVSVGSVATPTVSNSDLPGLRGLAALRKNRAILDFSIFKLHFCGPGDYDLHRGVPPGADSFQREIAPSGRMVISCCEYEGATLANDHTLTLVTNRRRSGDVGVGSSSSSGLPPRRRHRHWRGRHFFRQPCVPAKSVTPQFRGSDR
jgi:hypothetical protein